MSPWMTPHTATTGPMLKVPGHYIEIDKQTALLWIKTLSDFLYFKGPYEIRSENEPGVKA